MLATMGAFVFLATGLPPADMATVVADRLARLDRIVAEVEVQIHTCPRSASPLDETAWSAPLEPGDGRRRVVRIVRPAMLEESYVTSRSEPIVTSFTPGRTVRRAGASPRSGRVVYSIDENPISSANYTNSVPLLQLLDLHVHESHVPGLNVLSLLRNYPAELIASDGQTSTYAVTVQGQDAPAGAWVEHYDFDVNARGTPTRLRTRIETSAGFLYEREFFVCATQELNGAEFVTEAVSFGTNSAVQNYEVNRFVVCSVETDATLSPDDVLFEPERRNAVVWTRTWPAEDDDPMGQYQEYDESGTLVASSAVQNRRLAVRQGLLPIAAVSGLAGAFCIALVSGRKWRVA
jgi:hypothetical protein